MIERPSGPQLAGPLTFIAPLPGLGLSTSFVLSTFQSSDELFTLTVADTADQSAARLFLLDPSDYFLDYNPQVPLGIAADLAGTVQGPTMAVSDGDLAVLVVVHPTDSNSGPTANLLAPIIIHRTTRRAHQLVLDGTHWPLRAPLVSDDPAQ